MAFRLWAVALLPAAALAAGPPTYTKDIAPILFQRCTTCHRPGEIAPMSLLTYSEVRPWAKSIAEAVLTRKMPPWDASPQFGHFRNDSRLPDSAIALIKEWVKSGAPQGDLADLPPAPVYVDGWRNGKPDRIVTLPEPYQVTASGPDEYLDFTVDPGFTQDMWVRMAELRPGNRKVVHHAHVFLEPPAKPGEAAESKKVNVGASGTPADLPVVNDGCSTPEGGMRPGSKLDELGSLLASYVPGKGPEVWPDGIAHRIPAHSRFQFQIHYSHATGKPETDLTSVGLYFAPAPPVHELHRIDLHNLLFEIPAGAPNQEVTACYTFDKDVELLSYVAHMHLRGKDMLFEARLPDGSTRTLLYVPRYRFEWQMKYVNSDPIAIPKGTRIKVTAHFDNSINNAENPDPTKVVRWGQATVNEMMDGWLEFIE